MTNTEQQIAEDGLEIGLNDIIDFFVTRWKVLLVGTFSGVIVASGGTLLLGKYEVEATIINKPGVEKPGVEKPGVEKPGVDYLTWKSLKRNLPILAARISEATGDGGGFLRVLSSEKWWEKNVVPAFAFTKEDAKALSGISKELQDAEFLKIKDFVVTTTGPSKEDALNNLSTATSFLRSGAAYLALQDVIANYRIEWLSSESEIAKNISILEIELTYLNSRMVDLELLRAKFPGNSASIITQFLDPKDSSAKYLSVITQLIAVNRDISELKEKLSRLNSRKIQLAIMNGFLSQAMPIMDKNFDGLSVVAELMRIESGMRKDMRPSDWNKVSMLDLIKYDLTLIHTRFTLGLEQPTFFSTRKPPYLKHAAIGMASGFFLALLWALCSVVWLSYRQQKPHG